ncbi:MAG: MFS transporter, partial [Pseudonocardia sp.]|nr:MFS transporter [Pseudonocardia sp.]
RVAMAGLLGTFIEFYDYTLYAFLTVYLAPHFFPATSEVAGILATLGVFAVGYLARPLGALVLGRLGDRRGRRFALLVTITGMGVATTVMGLLPSYETIGVLAPILLVVTRLVQGFSAGGEVGGASTYVAESDGGRRRGRMQSFIPLGSGLGVALAPAVVGLTVALLGVETMADWGWRVPLLVSAVLAVLVLLYRTRIDDSDEFRALAAADAVRKSPVSTAVRRHWRMILAAAALNLVNTAILAVLVNYMNVYLLSTLEVPATTVFWLSAICLLIGVAGFPIGGWWVDRFGRRSTITVGYVGAIVLVFPLFFVMAGGWRPAGRACSSRPGCSTPSPSDSATSPRPCCSSRCRRPSPPRCATPRPPSRTTSAPSSAVASHRSSPPRSPRRRVRRRRRGWSWVPASWASRSSCS